MPRDPRGEKRPADAIGPAIIVPQIATGEIEDIALPEDKALHGRERWLVGNGHFPFQASH